MRPLPPALASCLLFLVPIWPFSSSPFLLVSALIFVAFMFHAFFSRLSSSPSFFGWFLCVYLTSVPLFSVSRSFYPTTLVRSLPRRISLARSCLVRLAHSFLFVPPLASYSLDPCPFSVNDPSFCFLPSPFFLLAPPYFGFALSPSRSLSDPL